MEHDLCCTLHTLVSGVHCLSGAFNTFNLHTASCMAAAFLAVVRDSVVCVSMSLLGSQTDLPACHSQFHAEALCICSLELKFTCASVSVVCTIPCSLTYQSVAGNSTNDVYKLAIPQMEQLSLQLANQYLMNSKLCGRVAKLTLGAKSGTGIKNEDDATVGSAVQA